MTVFVFCSTSSNSGTSFSAILLLSVLCSREVMMIFIFTKKNIQLVYFFLVSLAHWMDERQKVYKARQRRVETICQKFNVATFSSNDTMEDLINQSVHNDSASGNERLCEFIINKIFVKIAPLLLVYVLPGEHTLILKH